MGKVQAMMMGSKKPEGWLETMSKGLSLGMVSSP